MIECDKCGLICRNNGAFQAHKNSCNLTRLQVKDMIDDYFTNNLSSEEISDKYGISFQKIRNYFNTHKLNFRNRKESGVTGNHKHPRKHSQETKDKISNLRKKYLQDNPDKHPWKKHTKFVSKPCETLKQTLRDNGIQFIEEYTVDTFSIDIAFPDKMIGIEINGNQHYDKNGELEIYYQKRHDYLVNVGWTIHEIHYKMAYSKNILEVINRILSSTTNIYDFDYQQYLIDNVNKPKFSNRCVDCDVSIHKHSNRCVNCNNKCRVDTKRPPLDELENDINTIGYRATGRKHGVSDTSIRKWIKTYKRYFN